MNFLRMVGILWVLICRVANHLWNILICALFHKVLDFCFAAKQMGEINSAYKIDHVVRMRRRSYCQQDTSAFSQFDYIVLYCRPAFLPDPKDGSLYAFGKNLEGLKKLPFTIPELIAASPCKSSDGILYTGWHIYYAQICILHTHVFVAFPHISAKWL